MLQYILHIPIQIYIFIIGFPIFLLFLGRFLAELLQIKGNAFNYIYIGFCYTLAIFEIVWLTVWKIADSFNVLLIAYSVILAMSLGCGIYLVFKTDGCEQCRYIWRCIKKWKNIPILLFLLFHICNTFFLRYPGNTDDSYYLTKAGMIIRHGMLNPTFTEAGNGLFETSSFMRADISSWPAYLAYWACILKISPTVLAHVAFGVILIIVSACVTISIVGHLSKNSKQKWWFVIIYYALSLWTVCASDFWAEFWIVCYPWYGVAVLNVILFCLLDGLLYLYEQEDEYVYKLTFWIYVLVMVLACVQCEIVGIMLAPCWCVIYGLPYLFKIGWSKTKKLIPYLMIVLLPIAGFAISIVLQILKNKIPKGMLGLSSEVTWIEWNREFFCNNPIIVLWIFSIVYIIWRGNKESKYVFLGGNLVLWLTFLNPLFYPYVSNYILTNTVFYRIYWCIPLLYMVCYAASDILKDFFKKWKLILVAGTIVFYFSQTPKWSMLQRASMAENEYKLDNRVIEVADYMFRDSSLDEVRVIAPEQLAHYLRQYSQDILYPCSMRSSGKEIEGMPYSYISLYQSIYDHQVDEDEDLLRNLQKLGTDYIIYSEQENLPETLQKLPVGYVGGYLVISLR